MKSIALITLKSITPASLGGFDPNQCGKLFRITELRALGRWWLRTISSDIVGYNPQNIERLVGEIFGSKEKSSLLCFHVEGPGMNTSIIDLLINLIKIGVYGNDIANRIAWHPRLSLIFMRELGNIRRKLNIPQDANISQVLKFTRKLQQKVRQSNIPQKLDKMFRNLTVSIKILASAHLTEKTMLRVLLGIYSIVLGLLVSGLGKGSRRGFGSFIFSISFDPEIKKIAGQIGDYITTLEELSNLAELKLDSIREILKDVYNKTRILASEIARDLNIYMPVSEYKEALPPFPSISNAKIYLLDVTSIRNATRNLWNILVSQKTQNQMIYLLEAITILANILTLRTTFHPLAQTLMRNLNVKTLPAELQNVINRKATKLGSYVLGLPRIGKPTKFSHYFRINIKSTTPEPVSRQVLMKQFKKEGKSFKDFTGFNPIESTRRASPLILSAINFRTIVITLIKSSDFPDMFWGSTSPASELDVRRLEDAYNQIENYLDNLVKKLGGKTMNI